MSWKDTIKPVKDEVSDENVEKLKELYPDSFSVSDDDGIAYERPAEELPEEKGALHYMGQIPVGAVERGFSYFNPIARASNRISAMMLDMGINPMAAFVEGAPVFEKNPEAAVALRKESEGDTHSIWMNNPVYKNVVGERAQTPGEEIARAGGSMAMDTLATFGLAYPFLAARAATLPAAAPVSIVDKARGGLSAIKNIPANVINLIKSESSGGNIARLGTKYLDDMARFVATKPKTALWLDTMSGIGGGLAAESARQAGASPMGELGAGLAGGLGAGFLSTGAGMGSLYRGARDAMHHINTDQYASRQVDKALKRLNQSLTPEAEMNIAEATRIKDKIPGFNFTLGEAAGDVSPSFITDQITLQNQLSGSALDQVSRSKDGAIRAIRDFEQGVIPDNFGLDDIKERSDDLIKNVTQTRQRKLDEVTSAKSNLTNKLTESDKFKIGERLRGAYDDLESQVSQDMGKQAAELGLNTKNITGYKALKERYEGIISNTNRFVADKSVPSYLKDVVSKMDNMGKEPFTFQDVKTIREESGRLMRKELNSPTPDTRKVSLYKQMRDATDDFLDTDLPKDMGDMGEKYSAWRKSYVDNYVKRFEQGGVNKVGQGLTGDYVTENERIADLFFKKGNQSAAKQFNITFGNNPEAKAAMRDAIIDKARRDVIKDGEINAKSMDKWFNDHADVLNEFPDVKKELSDINNSSRLLMERGQRLAERAKEVDKSFIKEVTKSDDTSKIMRSALRDHKKMRELRLASRKNPDALRRAVWDEVIKSGGGGDVPSGELIKEFMNKHNKSLSVVFDSKHLNDLEDVASAYGMLGRVPKPFGKSISKIDPVEEKTGSSAKSLLSSYRAIRHGRTSAPVEMSGIASRFIYAKGRDKANEALLEALYKPELVRELRNTIKSQGRNKTSFKRLNTWALAQGIDVNQNESVPQLDEEE